MKTAVGPRRVGLVALAAVLSLTACKDNGLAAGTNRPLDDARTAEWRYPPYEAAAESKPVAIAGRAYVGSAPEQRIAASMLEPVGTVDGITLYAVRGSEAPHSRLYAASAQGAADLWRPYLRLN